jgi:CubicO group peptidase (beta-lactamase class C family)
VNSSRSWCYFALAIVVLALPAGNWCLPKPQKQTVNSPLTQNGVIDALRDEIKGRMDRSMIPGLSIAIVDGDKVVWSEGFGFTERNGTQRVTADTLFSMQSISKHFMVLGFLKAVERRQLSLDEQLTHVVPGFTIHSHWGPNDAQEITFRQLLSHWSGLPHEAPVGNNYDFRNTSFQDHIASISDVWLRFPVGERYSYSNLGMDMAGQAMQIRTGRPFATYMREEVLAPLGMTSSTVDQVEAWRSKSVAKGHPTLGAGILPYNPMVPSGSLYSSANDVAQYLIMRLNGGTINGRQFLGQNLLDEMCKQQYSVPDQKAGYGLGTYIETWHGTAAYGHWGEGFGYRTYLKWIPEYKIGVVVLANSNVNVQDVPAIANHALELQTQFKTGLNPVQVSRRPNCKPIVAVRESVLKRLEGTYVSDDSLIRFQVRNGQLFVGQHLADPFFQLSAHGETEFSEDSQPNRNTFRFILDKDQKPTNVLVLADNFVQRFSLNDQADEKPGPNRDEWKSWTGTYTATPWGSLWQTQTGNYSLATVGPEDDLFLTLRNGYLYLKHTDSPDTNDDQIKLTEWTPTLFFTPDGSTVEFRKGQVVFGNDVFSKK